MPSAPWRRPAGSAACRRSNRRSRHCRSVKMPPSDATSQYDEFGGAGGGGEGGPGKTGRTGEGDDLIARRGEEQPVADRRRREVVGLAPDRELLDRGAVRRVDAVERAPADRPDQPAGADRRAVRHCCSSRAPRRMRGTRWSAPPGARSRRARRPRSRRRRRRRRRSAPGHDRRRGDARAGVAAEVRLAQEVGQLVLADLQGWSRSRAAPVRSTRGPGRSSS